MFKKDNIRKNFLRVKQNIDQNLGRAEKSEVLSEDQQENEKRVDVVKHAFQNISKKASASLQAPGSDFDKRLKKLPETGVGNAMIESAQGLGADTLLGSACLLCGECQINLAKERLQYETSVEQDVVGPLQNVVEVEIPCIVKQRKALNKSTLDMDSAKSRFLQAVRQSSAPGANIANTAAKADVIRDELEEASYKVETIKDNLSIELCNFAAKECDHTQKLLMFLEAQANYHRKALEAIEVCLPQLRVAIQNSPVKPCYGMDLEEHLRLMCRDIAVVLEVCILTLLENGLEEEGLFRIAGSAIKVKKLKASFDAQTVDIEDFETDPHTVAGAMKQYLRELPEPLLTYTLHDEFMQAASTPHEYRLQALWTVINKLPTPNYNNFRYLMKFLSKLKEKSDVNKMKASNIAIVVGPNLLWSRGSDSPSMLTTGTLSSIVEVVVAHADDYFFPGVIDFHITRPGSSPKPPKEPPKILTKEHVEEQSKTPKNPKKEQPQPRGASAEKKLPLQQRQSHNLMKTVPKNCDEEDDSSCDDLTNPFSDKFVEKSLDIKKEKQGMLHENLKASSVIDTSTGDYDNIMYTMPPQSSLYRSNTISSLYPTKNSVGTHGLYNSDSVDHHNQPTRPLIQVQKVSTPSFQGTGPRRYPPFPLFYDGEPESLSTDPLHLSKTSPRHLTGSTPDISIYSKVKPEEKSFLGSQSSYWSRPSKDTGSLNYNSLKRGSAPSVISPPPNFSSSVEGAVHSHRRHGPVKISRSQLGQPPPPRHAADSTISELHDDHSKSTLLSRPVDKSFHEDTYGTAFALTSLGAGDTSSDYLMKVRAMWDDHHTGGSSLSRESSPSSNTNSGAKKPSTASTGVGTQEIQAYDERMSKLKDTMPRSTVHLTRHGTMDDAQGEKKHQDIDFTNVGYRYEEYNDKSSLPNMTHSAHPDGPTLMVPSHSNQHPANSGLSSPVSTNSSSSSLLVPSDSPEVSSPIQRRTSRKPAPPPPPERPFSVMVTAATTPVTRPDGDMNTSSSGDSGSSSQTWPRPAPLASPEASTEMPMAHDKERHKAGHFERPSMPPPERPKLPPPVTIAPGRGHQRSASTGAMMMSNAGGVGEGGDGAPGIPNAGTVSSYNIASSGDGSPSVETANTLSPLPTAGSTQTLGRSVSLRPRLNPPPPPPPIARESEDTKL